MTADVLKLLKPTTDAERTTRSTTDTIEVTPDIVKSWKLPPFQRELRINDKVRELGNVIKDDGGVIPGVLVIGVLDKIRYLIDGQHRREAFLLSGCLVGYVDVRVVHFATMGEMGKEFVNVNSKLVGMKPDDILRGLEGSHAPLAKLRRACPFIGYGHLRLKDSSPIVSMSGVLRCWFASAPEVPSAGGLTAIKAVEMLTLDEVETAADFLNLAMGGWGRDPEYSRLWLGLNLTICMWLYRRLVITPYSTKTQKLTKEQFGKLLMALSADAKYLEWLIGRQMRNSDRSPCYMRIKSIFAARIELETGKKPLLPSPAWASSQRGAGGGV